MKQKLLLTLLCLVCTMNGKVWAQTFVDGEIEWSFNAENGTLLIAGNGAMKDYSSSSSGTYKEAPWCVYAAQIKSVTIGEGVTRIGDYAFCKCSVLESVTFNAYSLTYIGRNAFASCELLEGIKLPNTIVGIGDGTFQSCKKLRSIVIPNSVEEIGDAAFANCASLEHIQLSENLKSLSGGVLMNCTSLKELVIPNSVEEIAGGTGTSYGAFSNSAIETLTFGVSSTMTERKDRMRMPSLKKVVINSKSIIDSFSGYFSESNYPLLSEIVIGDSIKSIGEGVFKNRKLLESVAFSEGVESIGENAFYGCSKILKVEIPNSVKHLGAYAFKNCTSLARITLGDSVVSIGEDVFANTRWDNNRPDGAIYLGKALMGYRGDLEGTCRLDVEEGTRCIADNAFQGFTMLDSIHIPNSVVAIGKKAFYRSGLQYVKLPDSLQEVSDYTFAYNELLKSIELPKTITHIGEYAFGGCGLLDIDLPESVISIGVNAFRGCPLTSINIPKSVVSIGQGAFQDCSLTSVDIPEGVIDLADKAFYGCPLNTLKVNSDYAAAKVQQIQKYDFDYPGTLANVVFGDGVSTVIPSVMENNTVLKSVVFGTDVKEIGDFAFCGCTSLNEVIFLTKEIPTAGMDCFLNLAEDCKIYVPDPEAYREAWPEYAHMIVDITGVVHIEGQAFTYTGQAPEISYTSKVPVNVVFDELMVDAGTYEAKGLAMFALGDDTVTRTVDCTYTIGKAPLYVVAADTSRVYGEENPEFEVSLYGFVNEEDSTVLTSLPTAYSDATAESNVGEYAIYTVGGEAKNYEFVCRTAILTIEKAEQEIIWELEADTVVVGTQLELTAAATSGLQVYYLDYDALGEGFDCELKGLYMQDGKFYLDCSEVGVLHILAFQDGMMDEYENYHTAYAVKELVVVEPELYALTYLVDGEVFYTDSLAAGDAIILPEEPTKEGYTFSGWSEAPETMPAEDVTISGTFTVNKYLVTFKIGDEVIAADSLEYGAAIVAPEAPEKEGHTFNGWGEVVETVPASDLTYEGTYTVNIYKVYYYVGEELVHTIEVAYGEVIPEYIYEPTGEGDVFEGWIGETYETMPAHDVTYTANITNGIGQLTNDNGQLIIYNLMGRKVLNTENLRGGIYIVNGKKVVIK